MIRAARAILSLMILASMLGACGFQLRSYNFEGNVASFAVTGQSRSQVAPALRRTLRQVGIQEVEPEAAELVVTILDQDIRRRSVSTAGAVRVAEYELDYRVRYEISDGEGQQLAAPLWVERQRTYRVDQGNIVGSSEEQALVERELLQDVVGQIVRAMDLVSRPKT